LENKLFQNLRDEESNSLHDFINILRLNLVIILLISVTGLIVSVYYASRTPDIYTATALIKLQQPKGSIISGPLIPTISSFGNDRFIANELEILKSYRMREIVAKALLDSFRTTNQAETLNSMINYSKLLSEKSDTNFSQNLGSIIGILSGVSVNQKQGLDLVEISATSTSPLEAKIIANTYAKAYENLNLKYERQQLISVKNFLEKQRNQKLDELMQSEDNLKRFQEQGGIIAIDEQAKALIDVITDFQSQRDATQIELSISGKRLQQYNNELEKKNPTIAQYIKNAATQPRLENLQKSIAQMETQRDVAISNTQGASRRKELVEDYNARIDELKSTLDEQLAVYKASIFASSPAELKDLSLKVLEEEIKSKATASKFESLDDIVRRYERRFNELPRQTIDYARFQRELTSYEKLYLLVEGKYQEALINEQSTPGTVLIIDEAIQPSSPSAPNRMRIILTGFIFSLVVGFSFAFIRHYLDNTVNTPEDIQKNRLNVLTWIPKMEQLATKDEFQFIVHSKPDSIYSESFRALRTRITFSKIQESPVQTILITSSAPREGKTTVAVNLSGSFAQANKKTIVVDCDLRKPRIHNVFQAQRFPGFSDYFFGQAPLEDIIHASDVPNLFYITSGTIPPNPSEILASSQMEAFLEKLRGEYDIIILDSPPIIAVTDSEILSRLVDATILVVSAHTTEVELMRKSAELLDHEQNTFIGVLLNNFSYKSGYGSYYKYYYYYSQGGNGAAKKNRIKA